MYLLTFYRKKIYITTSRVVYLESFPTPRLVHLYNMLLLLDPSHWNFKLIKSMTDAMNLGMVQMFYICVFYMPLVYSNIWNSSCFFLNLCLYRQVPGSSCYVNLIFESVIEIYLISYSLAYQIELLKFGD